MPQCTQLPKNNLTKILKTVTVLTTFKSQKLHSKTHLNRTKFEIFVKTSLYQTESDATDVFKSRKKSCCALNSLYALRSLFTSIIMLTHSSILSREN